MIELYFDKCGDIPSDIAFLSPDDTLQSGLVDDNYQVAIIGIKSESNASNPGSSLAPDAIRKHLYGLRGSFSKIKITDLGNLKQGKTLNDTYSALRDVIEELLEKNVIPVVIGGSHELTLSMLEGLKQLKSDIRLIIQDNQFDMSQQDADIIDAHTFLSSISSDEKVEHIDLLGYQGYYCAKWQLDDFEKKNFHFVRVGELCRNIAKTEPFFRDSDMYSVDISSIRQSDAPGRAIAIPNGLFGEEACQLSHYAGLSDRLSLFGIFEVNPDFDSSDQTAALAAQIVWHFLEGVDNRYADYPFRELSTYQKYVVPDLVGNTEMVFYNNPLNHRWWIEIPSLKGLRIYSCTYEDYQFATDNKIPDVWMKFYMK